MATEKAARDKKDGEQDKALTDAIAQEVIDRNAAITAALESYSTTEEVKAKDNNLELKYKDENGNEVKYVLHNEVGKSTYATSTTANPANILETFDEDSRYGMILRAKGIVEGENGAWIHFDYVPGEANIREGSADIIGRLCVIGADIKEEKIAEIHIRNHVG